MTSGYSGTPLAKKLGIKEGFRIALYHQPEYYFKLFTDFPNDVKIINKSKVDFIHYFVKDGMIWISWPKKSSKVITDITEDSIRNIVLKNGLVDIKVCSVDYDQD